MISESLQVIPFSDDKHRNGGKVMLPEAILAKLYDQNKNGLGEKPVYLQVTCVHKKTEVIKIHYVGILQFDYRTEPNCITLPDWIISESQLDVGDFVFIEDCQMPSVKQILIKNIIEDIYQIPDYQAVLQEYFSQQFICLQENMLLSLTHEGIDYEFVISSLKNENGEIIDHGSIHEVDLIVDIEDYFEKPKPIGVPIVPKIETPKPQPTSQIESSTIRETHKLPIPKNPKFTPRIVYHSEGFVPFSGGGYSLGGGK